MHKLITIHIGHNVSADNASDGRAFTHYPSRVLGVIESVLMSHGITNYTVMEAAGYWQGEVEKTSVVSILLRGDIEQGTDLTRKSAGEIRRDLLQDSVLFTVQDVEAEFIERGPFGA